MTSTQTFGRMPTLGEMKEYYRRDDVISFLYDECQMRNIDIAFRRKRWPINPTSKAHLRQIIQETIKSKIENTYKNSALSLQKFDYLSFHFHTSITSGRKVIGFDTIFEADPQGWRRAFEDLIGVIRLLDDFGVCYRVKYSGVRSLHFMIPFEALPEQFNGRPILSMGAEIHSRLKDYFRRHCGMEKAHGGSVMRLAYSLNEDNGLVSLPISSEKLTQFRPWEANIQNVTLDKPWHGHIPPDAGRRMLTFLREVYNDNAKARKSRNPAQYNSGLQVARRDVSGYFKNVGGFPVVELAERLKSDDEAERVEAAWNLMTMPESVPISVIVAGLTDVNPDVRWYLTEALQKHTDAEAVKLAGRMLWDGDQFVRISAIDALVLSGDNALQVISTSMPVSHNASVYAAGVIDDITYAIAKICPQAEPELMRSLTRPISSYTERLLMAGVRSDRPFWAARRYIRRLRELCKQHGIDESALFHDAIKEVVPWILNSLATGKQEYNDPWLVYGRIRTLEDIRKNHATPLMTMSEIANSLDIHDVKIPSNRMTQEEREFLTHTVRGALADKTLEQKAFILANFLLRGKKKISEPAGRILERIKQTHSSITQLVDEFTAQSVSYHGTRRESLQDEGIDELIGMLGEGWRMRRAAAQTLAEKCQTDQDIEKVISALQSRTTRARMGAVEALGEMMSRHKRAREAIVEALNAQGRTAAGRPFPRWDIRRAALKVYVRSNPPDAVEILIHAVDNWGSATARHDAVRELGRYMDNERVLSKLREIVADQAFPLRGRIKAEKLLRETQR